MTGIDKLPARTSDGNGIHVVVESPKGAVVKLKWDHELGVMTLSRPLPAGLSYPYDWGFVPGTKAEDGDPLDAMVLWDAPTYPGVVIACRIIGVVRLEQNAKDRPGRERNDRLIAVPLKARRWEQLQDVHELPNRLRQELSHFFVVAVFSQNKDPRILGWGGPAEAEQILDDAIRGTRKKAARKPRAKR